MHDRPFLKASLAFVLNLSILFAFVLPGDKSYHYYPDEKQSVIFDKNYTEQAQDFYQKAVHLHEDFSQSFGFHLTQTNHTILASPNNQISNAFATFLPHLSNGFYGGGAATIDYFGASSWMDLLTVHELAHTYQLDAKQRFSKDLQNIFGNNGMWFINPNYLLPTLVIEGNAVMNESRFGIGGRLFVGEHRALVYALSHDKKLNYTRLLNNHLSFPYGSEKYLVGGYFWTYLAERFGTDKANDYFIDHAYHYINPLRINTAFKRHFNQDFSTLIADFIKDLSQKSQAMHYLEGQTLSQASFIDNLNHNNKEIFWVQSSDRGPRKLLSFKEGKITEESTSLLAGKVFKIKDKVYTASQAFTDQSHILSGLFDDEGDILAASKDFYVQDRRAGVEIALHIPSSFDKAKLYKDGQFYAQVDSSSILDEEGNVYYGKQQEDKRTIYKNHTALFTFDGFNQKLLEVKNGKVWFIAPTTLGSTLYFYENNQIFRASLADNITDARIIDDRYFLGVAVTGDGHLIKKASFDIARPMQPVLYQYSFKELRLEKAAVDIPEVKAYKPIKELRFASFLPSIGVSEQGFIYDVSLSFMDAMQLNALTLRVLNIDEISAQALSYANEKYSLGFNASIAHVDDNKSHTAQTQGRFLVDYDFVKTSWDKISAKVEVQTNRRFDRGLQAQTVVDFIHQEHYALAYDNNTFYKLSLAHKSDTLGATTAVSFKSTNQWAEGLFVKTNMGYREAEENNIYISNDTFIFEDATDIKINDNKLSFYAKDASFINAETSLAFKSGLYFDVFPFSLRQSALFAGYSHFDYEFTSGSRGSFFEYYSGIEFELLGAHLATFKTRFLSSYNSLTQATSGYVTIALEF